MSIPFAQIIVSIPDIFREIYFLAIIYSQFGHFHTFINIICISAAVNANAKGHQCPYTCTTEVSMARYLKCVNYTTQFKYCQVLLFKNMYELLTKNEFMFNIRWRRHRGIYCFFVRIIKLFVNLRPSSKRYSANGKQLLYFKQQTAGHMPGCLLYFTGQISCFRPFSFWKSPKLREPQRTQPAR